MTTNAPTKIVCGAAHTSHDPSKEEFKCPECGAPGGNFAIDESAANASEECDRLHKSDILRCYKCGYSVSGSRFAARIMKQKNLVPCPTCKGHGTVKG